MPRWEEIPSTSVLGFGLSPQTRRTETSGPERLDLLVWSRTDSAGTEASPRQTDRVHRKCHSAGNGRLPYGVCWSQLLTPGSLDLPSWLLNLPRTEPSLL